ncbi:MAG: hypothetical protein IPO40_03840 [Fibrobacteres bacterium]|nr:hypothetical protein [Fibrobacterota bacterium]
MRIPPLPFQLSSSATLVLALSLATSAADKIVACVGNSITFGYDLPWGKSYPTVLDTLLGTGYAVSNFGVSGKTMVKGSNESYWKETAYTNALASQPDIVIIELGTNDAKTYIWGTYGKDFKADYLAMIKSFRDLPSRPEVWLTLQPRANNESWSMYDNDIARKVNPLIREVALEAGTHLIDLRAGFAGHPEWYMSDSVHPNVAGAKAMATLVANMLKREPPTIRLPAVVGGRPEASLNGSGYQWYRNDTLLAGDTLRTLRSGAMGTYKVSVKIEAGTENRLVSTPYRQLSNITTPAKGRRPMFVGGAGDLRPNLPAGVDPESIALRDTRGRKMSLTDRLAPGTYTWSIRSPGLAASGILVAP